MKYAYGRPGSSMERSEKRRSASYHISGLPAMGWNELLPLSSLWSGTFHTSGLQRATQHAHLPGQVQKSKAIVLMNLVYLASFRKIDRMFLAGASKCPILMSRTVAVESQGADASGTLTRCHFASCYSLSSVQERAFWGQGVHSMNDQHKSNGLNRQAPGRSKYVARCPRVILELVVSPSRLVLIWSHPLQDRKHPVTVSAYGKPLYQIQVVFLV